MIDVSVVLVNYRKADLTDACIDSIMQHTADVRYEIIVVDNASGDGSAEHLRARFPSVSIIESPENVGFGSGNNLGADQATGKYLFFLNNDTIVHNNAIKMLYDFYEQSMDPHLGVVGCFLLNPDGTPGHSVGDFPNVWIEPVATAFRRLLGLQKENQIPADKSVVHVDFVSGADMFFDRAIYDRHGGFDPAFFMFYEETELQHRYSSHGYRNYAIRGPEITHLEGRSFDSGNRAGLNFKRIQVYRSHLIYCQRTMQSTEFSAYRVWYLLKAIAAFLFSLIRGKYSWHQSVRFIAAAFGHIGEAKP